MTTPRPPRIFISATSSDLGSLRVAIREALLRMDCLPVEQTSFPPDYRTVADFLKSEIARCDAIIHVAGIRYGAEPDPTSLPAGADRRSYTQMEYDVARQLNKKVFTFICAADFPYDQELEEPEDKRALQAAHRAQLAKHGAKYERIADESECSAKVLQLRVQLDELIRVWRAQQRRQYLAGAGVLSVLLVVIALSYANFRAIKQTDASLTEGHGRILEAQSQALRKVIGIDEAIVAASQTELLSTVSASAGVDATQVFQLIKQGEANGKAPLDYAGSLRSEKRHDMAFALSRFAAECAIRPDSSDFGYAAKAFLFAAEEVEQLSLGNPVEEYKKRMDEIVQLTTRGLDCIETLSKSASVESIATAQGLAFARAKGLFGQARYGELRSRKPSIEQALKTIDEVIQGEGVSDSLVANASRVRGYFRLLYAECLNESLAKGALADGIKDERKAIELYEASGEKVRQSQATYYMGQLYLASARLSAGNEQFELLRQTLAAIDAARVLTEESTGVEMLSNLDALEGLAHFEWVMAAPHPDLARSKFEAAVAAWKRVLSRPAEIRGASASQKALVGLSRAYALCGELREAKEAFNSFQAVGLSEDPTDLANAAAYARRTAHDWNTQDLSLLEDIVEKLGEARLKHSPYVAPLVNVELGLAEARCKYGQAFRSERSYGALVREAIDLLDEMLARDVAKDSARIRGRLLFEKATIAVGVLGTSNWHTLPAEQLANDALRDVTELYSDLKDGAGLERCAALKNEMLVTRAGRLTSNSKTDQQRVMAALDKIAESVDYSDYSYANWVLLTELQQAYGSGGSPAKKPENDRDVAEVEFCKAALIVGAQIGMYTDEGRLKWYSYQEKGMRKLRTTEELISVDERLARAASRWATPKQPSVP